MSSALKPLGVLCAAAFFCYLPLGITLGTIPVFVHQTLGYGDLIVGLVIAMQSLATILTRGFAGHLIDTRGSKIAQIIGCASMAGGGVLFAVALLCAASPILSVTLLLVSRLALGVGESMSITGALGWGVSVMGHQRAGAVMVWVGIALYAAIGLGAPLGANLGQHLGLPAAGYAAFAASVIAMLLVLSLRSMPIVHGERASFFAVARLVAPSGICLALSSMSFSGLAAFVTLLFAAHRWSDATAVLAVFAATYILARLFFGHLPDRFGGARVALAALALEVVGQILIWRAGVPAAVFIGAIFTAAGYSRAFPALGVEAVRHVPPQSRGSAMGAYVAFFDLGFGVSGPLNGAIAASFGYATVYLAGAVAAAAGCLVVLSTLRERIVGRAPA
jgi:MFS family permease